LHNRSPSELNGSLTDNPALRRFAFATAAATFVLLCVGGLVTSHGVGLAVPDWPNSYGYNMFFFPVSKWIGGIRFEHVHRLAASGVGFLTTVMALWLYGRKAQPLLRWGGLLFLLGGLASGVADHAHLSYALEGAATGLVAIVAGFVWPKCEPSPKWLRTLGLIAFVAVVAQGVLGGLRVTRVNANLGIFHATLAQLFFVLMCAIALFHTAFWRNLPVRAVMDKKGLRLIFLTVTGLILMQLILGATMRHQHAGLAIPDFPAAYGKIWPATDAASVLQYNLHRLDGDHYQPITAFQVVLQMIHRILALLIFLGVGLCAWITRRELGTRAPLSHFTLGWFLLIVTQIFLGAATIWSGKSADIATAHVACGALSLMTGGLISILSFRLLAAPVAQTFAQKNKLTSLRPSSSMTP
jgi:heme a synthase